MRRDSLRQLPLALLATLGLAGVAQADDVYTLGANGQPPLRPLWTDVSVMRVDDEKLVFRTRGGGERSVELASVFRVALPNDPVFTAADDAYASRDWERAIDGFQKLVAGADASWKARYVAPRLLTAAGRADRFDAALTAFVATARLDPKSAAAAKPKLPARGSKFLDDAVKALEPAIRTASSEAQRQTLLAYLLEVQLARGDAAAVQSATDQLATATNAPTAAADPKVAAVGAEVRLTQARAAMQAKRYADAISAIESAAPLINDPSLQAEALTILADARGGMADASGDAGARRDAAIAYLRIVAHLARDADAAAETVPRALLSAGRQQAAAGGVVEARALYDQLRAEYPNAPAAAEAAALAAKLPPAGG